MHQAHQYQIESNNVLTVCISVCVSMFAVCMCVRVFGLYNKSK